MRSRICAALSVLLVTSFSGTAVLQAQGQELEVVPDPHALVEKALDLTRSTSSHSQMSMTISRPTWQRTSSLVAWTRGREDSLIRFTAPAKDAGNALLKQGDKMWTYNPKLNRNIRLPSSMMSQSWAGSDYGKLEPSLPNPRNYSYSGITRKWGKNYGCRSESGIGENGIFSFNKS